MNPDISVVIATFQQPARLLKCLDALERQSLPRHQFEVIVVDDGDSPATATAVALFTRQLIRQHGALDIRYLPQPIRRGATAARNRGWQVARGRIIAFASDDYLPQPNWLTKALLCFRDDTAFVATRSDDQLPYTTDPTRSASDNCFCLKTTLDQLGEFPEANDSQQADAPVSQPVRRFWRHIRVDQQALPVYWVAISGAFTGLMGLLPGGLLLTIAGFSVWVSLSALFGRHEQLALRPPALLTSLGVRLAIPFVSVYWQVYSTLKYGTMP